MLLFADKTGKRVSKRRLCRNATALMETAMWCRCCGVGAVVVLVLRCCGGVVINEEQEEAGTNTRINLVQPIIWYRALIGAANHYFFLYPSAGRTVYFLPLSS